MKRFTILLFGVLCVCAVSRAATNNCSEYVETLYSLSSSKYQNKWNALCDRFASHLTGDDRYYYLQLRAYGASEELWKGYVNKHQSWFCNNSNLTETDKTLLKQVHDNPTAYYSTIQKFASNWENAQTAEMTNYLAALAQWKQDTPESEMTVNNMPRIECSSECRREANRYIDELFKDDEDFHNQENALASELARELLICALKALLPETEDMHKAVSLLVTQRHTDQLFNELFAKSPETFYKTFSSLFAEFKRTNSISSEFKNDNLWDEFMKRNENDYNPLWNVYDDDNVTLAYPDSYKVPEQIMNYKGMFSLICKKAESGEGGMLMIIGTPMELKSETEDEMGNLLNTMLDQQVQKMTKQETLTNIRSSAVLEDSLIKFPNRYVVLTGEKYGVPLEYFIGAEFQNDKILIKMIIYENEEDFQSAKAVANTLRAKKALKLPATTSNRTAPQRTSGQNLSSSTQRSQTSNIPNQGIGQLQNSIYTIGFAELTESRTSGGQTSPFNPQYNSRKKLNAKCKGKNFSFKYPKSMKLLQPSLDGGEYATISDENSTADFAISSADVASANGQHPARDPNVKRCELLNDILVRTANKYKQFYSEPIVTTASKDGYSLHFTHYIAEDADGMRVFGMLYVRAAPDKKMFIGHLHANTPANLDQLKYINNTVTLR